MFRKFVFLLSNLGFIVSGYLLWTYLSGEPIACTTKGCEIVRASSYSYVFGIPQPVLGVAFYLTIMILSFVSSIREKLFNLKVNELLFVLSAVGLLYSAYLTSLEAFVIKAYCVWCLVSAAVATLIFLTCLGEVIYEKRFR